MKNMSLRFILLMIFVAAPAVAKDFTATSFKSHFTVVGKIEGSYSRLSGGIIVSIQSGSVQLLTPKKSEKVEISVKSVRAMLVHYAQDGKRFNPVAYSDYLTIDQLLTGPIAIPPTKLKISTSGIRYSDLKDMWIAFEIGIGGSLTDRRTVGFCYIHVPSYLFTDTSTEFPYRF